MPLVTVTLRPGKSAGPGLNPENVTVVFKETGWENWAFSGARIIYA